jgi:hypothetical protein
LSGIVYDKFGLRLELTGDAVLIRSLSLFGGRQRFAVSFASIDGIHIKWTGLTTLLTDDGLTYPLRLGGRANEVATAIRDAAALSGSHVPIELGADPRRN